MQNRLVGGVLKLLQRRDFVVSRVDEQTERLVRVRGDDHPIEVAHLTGHVPHLNSAAEPDDVGDRLGGPDVRKKGAQPLDIRS